MILTGVKEDGASQQNELFVGDVQLLELFHTCENLGTQLRESRTREARSEARENEICKMHIPTPITTVVLTKQNNLH